MTRTRRWTIGLLAAAAFTMFNASTSRAHHGVIATRAATEIAATAARTAVASVLAWPFAPAIVLAGYARGATIAATAVHRMVTEPHPDFEDFARATRWEVKDWAKGNSLVRR
jgi:hypothetical protein